jgi:membrane associated rhomboid family serine protease
VRARATLALIVLNVAVFIWQYTVGDFNANATNLDLVNHGALFGAAVEQGQWWRILSGAFEHANLLHIAMNMFALYQVGAFVEIIAGRSRMLAIYFISMLGSGLAVTYFAPETVTVGASGAIFGLFGALVAIGVRLGKDGRSLISQTLPIIGINLFLTFTIPNISQAAHVGGLISGFISGLALFALQRRAVVVQEEAQAEELFQHPGSAFVEPAHETPAVAEHAAHAVAEHAAYDPAHDAREPAYETYDPAHDAYEPPHQAHAVAEHAAEPAGAGDVREAAEEEPR